jgi:hypothetical protein
LKCKQHQKEDLPHHSFPLEATTGLAYFKVTVDRASYLPLGQGAHAGQGQSALATFVTTAACNVSNTRKKIFRIIVPIPSARCYLPLGQGAQAGQGQSALATFVTAAAWSINIRTNRIFFVMDFFPLFNLFSASVDLRTSVDAARPKYINRKLFFGTQNEPPGRW